MNRIFSEIAKYYPTIRNNQRALEDVDRFGLDIEMVVDDYRSTIDRIKDLFLKPEERPYFRVPPNDFMDYCKMTALRELAFNIADQTFNRYQELLDSPFPNKAHDIDLRKRIRESEGNFEQWIEATRFSLHYKLRGREKYVDRIFVGLRTTLAIQDMSKLLLPQGGFRASIKQEYYPPKVKMSASKNLSRFLVPKTSQVFNGI